MPRLAPSLLHHARRKNPLLPILLRECRDTRSAENELRWLTEHAFALQSSSHARKENIRRSEVAFAPGWRTVLHELVRRRARGEPLQYILGTQPFGDLEILCQRGVLIPRPETEAYTAKLAGLVKELKREETAARRQKLRILDLCTGTGCISLLLHTHLRPRNTKEPIAKDGLSHSYMDLDLDILGVDISKTALRLAENNLLHNLEHGNLYSTAVRDISFVRANVLNEPMRTTAGRRYSPADPEHEVSDADLGVKVPSTSQILQGEDLGKDWDILIANPPYISPRHFAPGGTTTRSVRRWEPQLALVPRPLEPSISPNVKRSEHSGHLERGDEFYPALLELARSVDAKAVVLEVGDNEQAHRVRQMAIQFFTGESDIAVEVWRDDGAVDTAASDRVCSMPASECRAVVVWRSSWAKWRTRTMGAQKHRV